MTRNDQFPPKGWAYEGVAAARLQTLLRPVSIEVLIDAVVANAQVAKPCPSEPCGAAMKAGVAAQRTTFELCSTTETSRLAIDQLLNGAYGIRAHYALSSRVGDAATHRLARAIAAALRSRLLQWPDDSEPNAKSIRSSKVWFTKADDTVTATEDGTVTCDMWRRTSANPAAIVDSISTEEVPLDEPYVRGYLLPYGSRVPVVSALGVKGAFVRDDNGRNYVVKRTRAQQIHLTGWT